MIGMDRGLLHTEALSVTFGGLRAVDRVDIDVHPGQLVGLIGPNGAGKTTFIDGVTGFVPTTGRVVFDGHDLGHVQPHKRARFGLGQRCENGRDGGFGAGRRASGGKGEARHGKQHRAPIKAWQAAQGPDRHPLRELDLPA